MIEDSETDSDGPCDWLDDFDCMFIHPVSSGDDVQDRDALSVRQGVVNMVKQWH